MNYPHPRAAVYAVLQKHPGHPNQGVHGRKGAGQGRAANQLVAHVKDYGGDVPVYEIHNLAEFGTTVEALDGWKFAYHPKQNRLIGAAKSHASHADMLSAMGIDSGAVGNTRGFDDWVRFEVGGRMATDFKPVLGVDIHEAACWDAQRENWDYARGLNNVYAGLAALKAAGLAPGAPVLLDGERGETRLTLKALYKHLLDRHDQKTHGRVLKTTFKPSAQLRRAAKAVMGKFSWRPEHVQIIARKHGDHNQADHGHRGRAEANQLAEVCARLPDRLTKPLNDYTRQAFRDLNDKLRSGRELLYSQQYLRDRLDEAIRTLPPTTGWMTVTREGELPPMQVGDTFSDAGFVSTSIEGAANPGFTPNFAIHLPPGTRCAAVKYVSNHPDEEEILLPRNAVFEVMSISPTWTVLQLRLPETPTTKSQPSGKFTWKPTDLVILPRLNLRQTVRTAVRDDKFTWQPGDIQVLSRKHLGPGPHPDGTPQSIHGGDYQAEINSEAYRNENSGPAGVRSNSPAERQMQQACVDLCQRDAAVADAIADYTGSYFAVTNTLLRKRLEPSPVTQEIIEGLDAAMHPALAALNLNRSGFIPLEAKVGDEITDAGFCSTHSMTDFTGRAGNISIAAPPGTRCVAVRGVSKYAAEEEIILARNTRFLVESVEPGDRPDYRITRLRVLPPLD